MIPDHLIDKAAAAIYASSVFGDRFAIDAWHDMADDNPVKTGTRELATAALEAVAADIWDQGWRAGSLDVTHRYSPETPNPYLDTEDE